MEKECFPTRRNLRAFDIKQRDLVILFQWAGVCNIDLEHSPATSQIRVEAVSLPLLDSRMSPQGTDARGFMKDYYSSAWRNRDEAGLVDYSTFFSLLPW